jgi:hypothetical protein
MSRSAAAVTFLDACLAGRASPGQIDDWVERWHGLGPRDRRTLPEYLGMSGDEYARWVERPSALDAIFRARLADGSVPDEKAAAAASRSRTSRRR